VKVWSSNSRQPLPGVTVFLGAQTQSTDTSGLARFTSGSESSLSLSASVDPTSPAYSHSSMAVTLEDAVSILKMIANPPALAGVADGLRLQSLAADFDGSGTVSLADAIGVLRHAVGLQAPAPSWVFVEEGDDAMLSALDPGVPRSVAIEVAPTDPAQWTLIGVLRGDVDASWDPQRFGVSGEL
jgi:hypothetical protein